MSSHTKARRVTVLRTGNPDVAANFFDSPVIGEHNLMSDESYAPVNAVSPSYLRLRRALEKGVSALNYS